jgi:hypothetical protein
MTMSEEDLAFLKKIGQIEEPKPTKTAKKEEE